jgi:hypothetical protein
MKKRIIFILLLTGVLVQAFSQSFSGSSYRYSANAWISFSSNSFNGSWNKDTPMSGSYSVSGNRLTLSIASGPKSGNTWNWTIVNANTLRDQDGDTWTLEGSGASSGSSPSRSSSASAASSGVKNYISGEISFFGGGARYERMLSPKMSIGANVYYNTWIFWDRDFGVDGVFRFYPMGGNGSIAQGLYFGGAIGFHMAWSWGSYGWVGSLLDDDYSWGSIIGGAITPDVGWKIDFGDPGGFFISPGVKIPVTLGARKSYYWYDLWDNGNKYKFDWNIDVIVYVGLGFAF